MDEIDLALDIELPEDELSPRHRRLAELVAAGADGAQIKEALGYSDSRISVLKRHPLIAREIKRISDRIYEDTIGSRLKKMTDPALNVLESIITDKTNRVKTSEKLEAAKWILEKIDGKAMQKYDVGENLLGVMMDKLDAMKALGKTIQTEPKVETQKPEEREVLAIEAPKAPKTEEDLLDDWVVSYTEVEK